LQHSFSAGDSFALTGPNGQFDLSQLPRVLDHLQSAEIAVNEGNSRAWYEFIRANLVLYQMRYPLSGYSPSGFSSGWLELEEDQRNCPEANFEEAANWLHGTEKSLADTLPGPCVLHSLVIARQLRARARESLRWRRWGYGALIIEIVYVLILLGGLFAYQYIYGEEPNKALWFQMTHIPLYIFVWGFLGGIAWCTYSAANDLKRRLFDSYQLGWYVAHPWISALLGATAVLLVLGGLSTVSSVKLEPDGGLPTAAAALLSLVSFATGYSTIFIWGMLDRVIRAMFHQDNIDQKLQQQIQDHLPDKSDK
jgi:hypothetical protein